MNQGYQVITLAAHGRPRPANHKDLSLSELEHPTGLCCSEDGRLYVSELYNDRIFMIHNHKVTVIAGSGKSSGFQDGNALQSKFDGPIGICMSKDGRLYVIDSSNYRVRMIYNNRVATIAGSGDFGFQDGNALEAMFRNLWGICCSSNGRIYVTDKSNHAIRMIYNNQVVTIAGKGKKGFKDGKALKAKFNEPSGLCCSNDDRLYVTDRANHAIRMIYNGEVTTIAGNGKKGFQDGNALKSRFHYPSEICASKNGSLYVSDTQNNRIRMIYNGQVTTIAGNGQKGFQDGNALQAMFNNPSGLCCSKDGRLYVADSSHEGFRMIYNDQQSPFGFALLLNMQIDCDCQISLNNMTYHLHSTLVNLRCPLLFDPSCLSLIQQSNISNKSFGSFVIFLYSNTLTKEYRPTWATTISIKTMIELMFLFDLLMNCKWILTELESSFMKQLIEILTINQQSMRELIVDLLPLMFRLKETIKSKHNMSNMIARNTIEHCYNILINELKKKQSIAQQYMTELQNNLPHEYANIMNDIISERSQIDPIDDESTIVIGAEMIELAKLAFHITKIRNVEENGETQPKPTTTISTQYLDQWIRPDFIIKLPNDNIEYHVHKLILCGRWQYFCQMIESGLKVNQMTLTDDWNRSRFEKMMKYIYLNEIEFESSEDAKWLMENRKLYGITVDKQRNESTMDEQNNEISQRNNEIEERASYGFKELYDHCISVSLSK